MKRYDHGHRQITHALHDRFHNRQIPRNFIFSIRRYLFEFRVNVNGWIYGLENKERETDIEIRVDSKIVRQII